ncbi:hypothetical protein E2562_016724 [Oryza meyeriana var. granulata]|uniref:Uncharacterized protein n=1 Tax=Oryza meyeriana var. granulata TaxID=110450 RepID=A0A6G1BXL3_9ORYZ|nr:hypothetical protein E2562_016724 [Oryza meyeriana var. granulata]
MANGAGARLTIKGSSNIQWGVLASPPRAGTLLQAPPDVDDTAFLYSPPCMGVVLLCSLVGLPLYSSCIWLEHID